MTSRDALALAQQFHRMETTYVARAAHGESVSYPRKKLANILVLFGDAQHPNAEAYLRVDDLKAEIATLVGSSGGTA